MLSLLVVCFLCLVVPCYAGFLISSRVRALSFVLPCVACFIIQHLFVILISLIINNYQVAQFFSFLVVLFFIQKYRSCNTYSEAWLQEKTRFFRIENILPLALFFVIFIGYLLIRCNYAFIAFYNNGQDAGVEKLFNLSLQQSFLYGNTWPPEWVWLHGEPIKYYIFLRSIPGIISSHVRVLCGDPASGGSLFILSEAIFAALTPALISAYIFWFLRDINRKLLATLSLATPLISFLGVHYKGFLLGISAFAHHRILDWWILPSEVIPYTHSQYPIWFMLLGDNHAYSQVYFLQVLFLGAIIELTLKRKICFVFSSLVGLLASTIALSHSGSVLVDLFVLTIFFVQVFLYLLVKDKAHLRSLFFNLLTIILSASAVLMVAWSQVGEVKMIIPEMKLLTPLGAFFSQNFTIFIFLLILSAFSILIPSTLSLQNLSEFLIPCSWVIFSFGIISFSAFVSGYESVSIIIMSTLWTFLFAVPRQNCEHVRNKLIVVLFACSLLLLLSLPELIAFDHTIDSRTDWIRFQMGLRVWPESYILIPFGFAIAIGSNINENLTRWRFTLFSLILSVFICSLFLSHIPGIMNRISRSEQPFTIDGFSYLQKQFPEDAQIVNALRLLKENRIVIGELCAVYSEPGIPNHFGWSGRIAAFSGRTGICGWGRHALLYNKNLESEGFIGMSLEGRINEFAAGYKRILLSAEKNTPILASDRAMLSTFGVTHLILGIQEKKLFPNANVSSLATEVGGDVLLETGNGMGVVALPLS